MLNNAADPATKLPFVRVTPSDNNRFGASGADESTVSKDAEFEQFPIVLHNEELSQTSPSASDENIWLLLDELIIDSRIIVPFWAYCSVILSVSPLLHPLDGDRVMVKFSET